MRILVIEDDLKLSQFVGNGLKQAGYSVDTAMDGEEGLFLATTEPYDAIILDIMLPKLDGLSLLEKMRTQHADLPVIILSAKRSVDERIRGLQAGSDDYLVKPFVFAELLARLQALLRRSSCVTIRPATTFMLDNLTIDIFKREVTRGGKKIDLQLKEFSLLEYLIRNAGRVVSKTMILEHIWDYNFDPQTNVVDVLVCRLRGKLDRDFEKKLLHTIRGMGYVLKN